MLNFINDLFGSVNTAISVLAIIVIVLLIAYYDKIAKTFRRGVEDPVAVTVEADTIDTNLKRVGVYIGPVLTATVIRPVVSLSFGFTVVAILYGIDILAKTELLDFWMSFALALALSWWFGQNESEVEHVPAAHAAMITFMGKRLNWYRTEGDYVWTGKKIFFGRSTRVVEPGTDKDGFVFLGDIQIVIWNQGSDKDNALLSVIGRDDSVVYANLLIVLEILNPMKWLNSHNPLLDIAERTRSALRTAAEFLIGKDSPGLKHVLRNLIQGETLVTSFLQKRVDIYDKGSVVRNIAGTPLFALTDKSKGIDIPVAETAFIGKLIHVDTASKKVIMSPAGGVLIEHCSIDESLREVIEAAGAMLCRVSIGDMTNNKEVADAANKAASEVLQRAAQIASAETTKDARKILTPTATQAAAPGYEMATILAAAQDNPRIKVVFAPGADSLSRAAIAGALQIGSST